MKVINIFGAPCSGKSKHAARLYAQMKEKGLNCELCTEYPKELVLSNRKYELEDQIYIFAKHWHKLWYLRNKVDYVVTDSPLLLGLVYLREFHTLRDVMWETYYSLDNINFFLRIDPSKYSTVGRVQTLDEALRIQNDILVVLDRVVYFDRAPEVTDL